MTSATGSSRLYSRMLWYVKISRKDEDLGLFKMCSKLAGCRTGNP